MPILASCPTCANGLRAPDHLAGGRVKCLRCGNFLTLPGAQAEAPESGTAAASAPRSAVREPGAAAVRAAFWLGLTALAAGLAACVVSLFPGTAGFCRAAAWVGLLLGGGGLALSLFRDECAFALPFSGTAASLLALALVAFGLGGPSRPGRGDEGRPPGPPPGWSGKGGPPQGRRGGAPGDKGKGGPPPADGPGAPPDRSR